MMERADAVGCRCTWSTPRTRGRGRLEHAGTIEAYVPAGTSLAAAKMSVTKKSYSDVDARDVVQHDRYLVREDREGRNGRPVKARRYAPRCSDVEVRKS